MESPRDRIPYVPIIDRPPLTLPNEARMVVWTILNVEHWDSTKPQPRTILPAPMGQPLLPDVPNWSWHEYGNRVGFWRLRDMFQRFGIVPTLAVNGATIESYQPIVEAALEGGWEFLAHGYIQGPMHKLDDQRGTHSTHHRHHTSIYRQTPQGVGESRGSPKRWTPWIFWPTAALSMSPIGL